MRIVYGLSIDGENYVPASPVGYSGVDINREGVFYRTSLSSELRFYGDDYKFLKRLDERGCGLVYIRIDDHDFSYKRLFDGVASVKSLRWFPNEQMVSAEFEPYDPYKPIFDDWENEYNVLDAGISTNTTGYSSLPIEWQVAGSSPGAGWLRVPDITLNLYASEITYVICDGSGTYSPPAGTGWVFDSADCTGTGFAKYRREPQGYDLPTSVSQTGPFVSAASCTNLPSTDAEYHWDFLCNYGSASIYYEVYWDNPYLPTGDCSAPEMDNGLLLTDVIEHLVQQADASLTLSSHFLNASGTGDRPDNSYYNRAIYECQALMLYQLTDVVSAGASQNATIANTTLKDVLEWCKTLWDLDWWIEDGKFIIEHPSFINRVRHRQIEYAHLNFSYDTNRLRKRDKFETGGEFLNDFLSTETVYEGDCLISDNKGSYSARTLYTDFHGVCKNRSSVSSDGFVLIAAFDIGSQYSVINGNNIRVPLGSAEAGVSVTACSGGPVTPAGDGWTMQWEDCSGSGVALFSRTSSIVGDIQGSMLNNLTLALPRLQELYHTYNRPSQTGTVNGGSITFESVIRYKQQEDVLHADKMRDFDPTKLYSTNYGWGEVDSATISPDRRIRLKLYYDA